jgi:BlaI family penicillinase repressor
MKLTERELDVMAILWDAGPSSVAEVQGWLEATQGESLAYNSVLTFLRILEAKGFVAHEREGRAHRYRALVAREQATSSAIDRLVDSLFNGAAGLLAVHLLRDRIVDPEEIRQLREILDQRTEAASAPAPGSKAKHTGPNGSDHGA